MTDQDTQSGSIDFDVYPQSVRDWIREIGWKEEEVTDVSLEREVLSDGFDGQWKKWKPGKHMDVMVLRGMEAREQRFDTQNGWAKVQKLGDMFFESPEEGQEAIIADTDQSLSFEELVNAFDKISAPTTVVDVPLSVDPDDFSVI